MYLINYAFRSISGSLENKQNGIYLKVLKKNYKRQRTIGMKYYFPFLFFLKREREREREAIFKLLVK